MKHILQLDNCSLFTEDSTICSELRYNSVLHALQTGVIFTDLI